MGTLQKHDSKSIDEAIARIAAAIAARHSDSRRLLLLGIANGGIVLASRLASRLKAAGLHPNLGTIDISFHRDDIGHHPIPRESSPTLIPFEVNGATVILVDSVLFSGRTVKAALDELFDHGRPESVELAVLVDRGGRRLPIAADYCGLQVTPGKNEKVVVQLDADRPARDTLTLLPQSRPGEPADR